MLNFVQLDLLKNWTETKIYKNNEYLVPTELDKHDEYLVPKELDEIDEYLIPKELVEKIACLLLPAPDAYLTEWTNAQFDFSWH